MKTLFLNFLMPLVVFAMLPPQYSLAENESELTRLFLSDSDHSPEKAPESALNMISDGLQSIQSAPVPPQKKSIVPNKKTNREFARKQKKRIRQLRKISRLLSKNMDHLPGGCQINEIDYEEGKGLRFKISQKCKTCELPPSVAEMNLLPVNEETDWKTSLSKAVADFSGQKTGKYQYRESIIVDGATSVVTEKERELASFFYSTSGNEEVSMIKEVLDFEIQFTRERRPKVLYLSIGTLRPMGGKTFTRAKEMITCRSGGLESEWH